MNLMEVVPLCVQGEQVSEAPTWAWSSSLATEMLPLAAAMCSGMDLVGQML